MEQTENLRLTAARARLMALDMVYTAQSGHPGGSLSAIDIVTLLYGEILRADPKAPDDPDRDRFVLSKGHTAPRAVRRPCSAGLLPRGGSAHAAPH